MAALIAYIVGTVVFVVAWLEGGVHTTYADFVALGLALFTFGHVLSVASLWPPPSRPPSRP